MDENTPSYYAIIPADVRYSKEICDGAKLLYGEITALCNRSGYCWASNGYFSKLYDNDVNTVSRWMQELIKAGFIRSVIDKKGGNKRRVYLSPKIEIPIFKNEESPIPKKREYNSTKNNTKPTLLSPEELLKKFKERKDKFYAEIFKYKQKNPSKYPSQLYTKFFEYWTETNDLAETVGNPYDKKMRWENENFFEIARRMATFWSRVKNEERAIMWKQDENKGNETKFTHLNLFNANACDNQKKES